MVFESIIAEVLNKVLGDYVENLDQSQLRIGIWGGDVVLKDLNLKSTSLDELDLPIRAKYGNLGSLTLKIPWTNLYNAPVICTIEELYLLVVPNTQIEYSAEKEEKYNQDSKQAELRRVEDAKKFAREKDKLKGGDTFAEKLITQIIKNLQVKIVNIHVRYEDSFSIPERPFAFGVTLHSVSVHSTDEKWEECIIQNSDFGLMVFKMLDLRSLAVYFNCNTTLFPFQDIEATTELFSKTLSKNEPCPLNKYILAPINLRAQLRLNPKPETDGTNFKTPKVQLGLTLEKLAVGMTKEQYQSLFAFIDAIELMQRASLFQKFRPSVPVIGQAKLWWKFAYESVVEHDIRRVRRNWSWKHMREHRELCRRYMRAYLLKLRRKESSEVKAEISDCEKKLDVFNVIVLREEAEMQVDRETQSSAQSGGGWFRNWFSSAPREEESATLSAAVIMKKFEKAMTAEEKKKLFKAIDYQDNIMPTQYPLHFVENSFDFALKALTVEVLDEAYPLPRVIFVELENVIMHLEQRPAADAIKMLATIGSFGVFGMQQGDIIPHMVSYQPLEPGTKLIDMLVEVNPLDAKCDQLVQVTSRPLEIVFDGVTVLKLADIFTPPENILVQQLQAAAAAKFPHLKEMSAIGMQYAIEKHSVLDINIDLSSSYVILPHSGLYQRSEDQDLIIVNLGHVSMVSMNQDRDTLETVKDLHEKGMEKQAILEAMALKCYDKFVIRVDDIQVLMVLADEDWRKTLASNERCAMHLLEPTSVEILLLKCVLLDTSMPKCRMETVLPSVSLNVEDERIIHMASLFTTLVPDDMETNEEEVEEVPEFKMDTVSRVSTTSQLSRMATERPTVTHRMKAADLPEGQQVVEFQMDFVLKDLVISVFKCHGERDSELLISFEVRRLVFSLVQETWDLAFYANVGTMQLNFADGDGRIGMINVPTMQGEAKYMLLMKCVQAKRNTPDFITRHGSVLQHIDMDLVGMTLLLHQEALLSLLDFTRGLMEGLESTRPKQTQRTRPQRPNSLMPPPATQRRRTSQTIGSSGASRIKRRPKPTEITDLKIVAKLYSFRIELLSKNVSSAQFALEGGAAEIVVKKSYTEVIVKLKDFSAFDPNPDSLHHEILSVMGSEALSLQTILFNNDMLAETEDAVDISIVLKTSAVRVFFLNWFFSRLVNFVRPFQEVQEMMQEVAKEAAEQAILNAKEAYAKATRIALDVILQAPVIIIPANSRSIDALYLDMGTLIVKNRFEVLKALNDDGEPATVDELTLNLQDLKLSRVKLDDKGRVASELVLLKPLTGNVIVRRNLTSSWYVCIADLDISGRLETVAVSMCEDDFRVIMRIPQENLQEEDPVLEIAKYKSSASQRDMAEDSATECVVVKPLPPANLRDQILTMDPVTTAVKFNFTLDSLILDLFTNSGLPEEGDMRMNSQEKGLARFSLNFISVKGRVFSDFTISASLLLLDCLLDDTRPESKSKIKRFMQRKIAPSTDSMSGEQTDETYRSMVDVTFQKKGDNVFVDVRVFGFDLVLSTEYLMKIADFFCGWTYDKIKELQLRSQPKHRASQFSPRPPSGSTVHAGSLHQPPPTIETTSPPTPGTMTLNLHVEKPDIVMVEHAEDINTKALVMNTEITMKLRLSACHQCICGSVKDLQLYSCVYNPAKRNESTYQVLRPCSVSIAGSTPGEEGLHIDVCITPVRLSVSAGTLELIANVQRGLSLPETILGPAPGEVDHSKLWNATTFTEDMYWYLQPAETAEEASRAPIKSKSTENRGELCIISVSSVVMTVEAGVGIHTLPMILVEMSFNGAVSNWSSQLIIDSCMSLEVKYYNSFLAMWEPLLEPIELQQESGAVTHVPWELRLQLQVNAVEDRRPSSPTSEMDIEDLPPPATTIEISSKENLEIVLSKTCVNVLTNLAKSFQTAMSGAPLKAFTAPPFTVKNDTGLAVALLLENSPFQVMGSDADPSIYKEVMLETGAKVEMCLADPDIEDVWNLGLQKDTTEEDSLVLEQYLRIRVIERNCQLSLPVRRADKRYFSLRHRGEGNEPWGLVSDVQVKDGGTLITIRSIIQIRNHFNMPINVYYMTKRGNEVECIGTVEHKGLLNVPLYAVYTPTNELFFSVDGYTVSIEPFIWKDLQNLLSLTKNLQCDPKVRVEEKEPFIMKILGEMEQVFFENTSRHTMQSTCYNIHLRPTVIFKNHLPLSLMVCLANSSVEEALDPGQRLQLPTAEPGKCNLILRLPEYLEKEWSCDHELEPNPHEYTVWTFSAYDSQQRVNLDLGMRTVLERGSVIMTLYCPYWMLNKTGLMICYRKSRKLGNDTSGGGSPLKQSEESANVLYHPENFKGPVLFSFKAKSFFGKKKGSIKVEDSDWSDKFPLDVAGSSGLVSCRHGDIVYKIGVHIQLTFSSLTKQVTFTPYYVLLNNAAYPIEVQEGDRPADPWIRVEPNGCSALWPKSTKSQLHARVVGTTEMTPLFAYDSVYTTLLRVDNKYGGLNLDVQMAEGSVYISFISYDYGLAPCFMLNCLDFPISYHEKDVDEIKYLEPMTSVMFTWAKPTGSRTLVWANQKKKDFFGDLRRDGIGEFAMEGDQRAFWVSFLDGMQRVLLFTSDFAVARDAQSAGELEHIDTEITLAINGLGLSLVNDCLKHEVLYCSIASSGVVWESCKPHHSRYRPLNSQDNRLVEEAYEQHHQNQQYVLELLPPSVTLDNGMEIDFEKSEIVRPSRRLLRRSFSTGLWVQMKTSKHQVQLHAKVNRLQVDNQMADHLFPVVMAPVPLPRSISAASGFKPFLELSIVKRLMEHSPVVQYKYFKVLVQEFHIKLDIGFINGLVHFFEPQTQDEEEYLRFKEDLNLVNQPLMSHALLQSSAEQKNFYDLLHFSPLKIHLSFSLSSSGPGPTIGGEEAAHFINVLMQSLGVTLTDMQDVIFKLAYFERQYTFLTQRQLTAEVNTHYLGQLLRQLYVLVLGLDVLGNPYGLVVGMAQGVEDLFYEPFQGAIQGPGEFAEGLVLGVRSLVGHTVGGAAGAMSRITGAMGKGVAALTFDKEYQRKRREAIAHRPSNMHMGIAQSSKGLVMGVVAGVSGVFTKPVQGARQEGVEGFFKGVGKGVVGLVTRPTAGIIDFASGTLEQVKRAADPNEEVRRMRPPRLMHPDGQLRPFMRHDAEGNMILSSLDKGRYSTTDTYAFHVGIVSGAKDVLLLTDKRVMYIVHNDVFGGWQVEWEYTWDSLAAPPTEVDRGIYITTGESQKKVLGLFRSGADKGGKIIIVENKDELQWLLKKMNEIMEQSS